MRKQSVHNFEVENKSMLFRKALTVDIVTKVKYVCYVTLTFVAVKASKSRAWNTRNMAAYGSNIYTCLNIRSFLTRSLIAHIVANLVGIFSELRLKVCKIVKLPLAPIEI